MSSALGSSIASVSWLSASSLSRWVDSPSSRLVCCGDWASPSPSSPCSLASDSPSSPSSSCWSAWSGASVRSSPMDRSRSRLRARRPKAFWSPMTSPSLSRVSPPRASISARYMSTSGRAFTGGSTPVRRSRTSRETMSAMGGLDCASMGLNGRRAQAASCMAFRLALTPPRALAPTASIRACSRASKTGWPSAEPGRVRAWMAGSCCDIRRAIWSAMPRIRAASSGVRSRGGCGSTARSP